MVTTERLEELLADAFEIDLSPPVRLVFSDRNYAEEVFNSLVYKYSECDLLLQVKVTQPGIAVCYFTDIATADTIKSGELIFNERSLFQLQQEKSSNDFIAFHTIFKGKDEAGEPLYYHTPIRWQQNSLLNIVGYRVIENKEK
jgi:hypothetical protein